MTQADWPTRSPPSPNSAHAVDAQSPNQLTTNGRPLDRRQIRASVAALRAAESEGSPQPAVGTVDWKAPAVLIRGSVGMVEGRRVEGTTKSGPEREVSLDGGTVAALRDHRRRQAADRLTAGPSWVAGDCVFTTDPREPLYLDTVTNLMGKLIHLYNEPAVPGVRGPPRKELPPPAGCRRWQGHDLRHLHATMLLTAGVGARRGCSTGTRRPVDHAEGLRAHHQEARRWVTDTFPADSGKARWSGVRIQRGAGAPRRGTLSYPSWDVERLLNHPESCMSATPENSAAVDTPA
jgi:hypothetical protein